MTVCTQIKSSKDQEADYEMPAVATPDQEQGLLLQSTQGMTRNCNICNKICKWLILQFVSWAKKLPWMLASLVSLLYFFAFASRVSCDKAAANPSTIANMMCWKPLVSMTQGLHNGFCVWGSNIDTGICPSEMANSHQYSWYVDTVLAMLALLVGYNKARRQRKNHTHTIWIAVVIAATIFLHGFLHKIISHGIQCPFQDERDVEDTSSWEHCLLVCPSSIQEKTIGVLAGVTQFVGFPPPLTFSMTTAWIFYVLYTIALVVLDFSIANFPLSYWKQLTLMCGLISVSLCLGVYFGAAHALTWVFVQSHIMASVTGVFANSSAYITPLVGWCFLVATCVGMTEFLACESFLLPRYGHVWYDAALHVAMISALL